MGTIWDEFTVYMKFGWFFELNGKLVDKYYTIHGVFGREFLFGGVRAEAVSFIKKVSNKKRDAEEKKMNK